MDLVQTTELSCWSVGDPPRLAIFRSRTNKSRLFWSDPVEPHRDYRDAMAGAKLLRAVGNQPPGDRPPCYAQAWGRGGYKLTRLLTLPKHINIYAQ